jgi:hypothetical protein
VSAMRSLSEKIARFPKRQVAVGRASTAAKGSPKRPPRRWNPFPLALHAEEDGLCPPRNNPQRHPTATSATPSPITTSPYAPAIAPIATRSRPHGLLTPLQEATFVADTPVVLSN